MFSRTERLLLRPGWPEDAHALSIALSDEAVTGNLFDLPAKMTQEDAAALLTRDRGPLTPYLLLYARTGGAPRLVGGCTITPGKDGARELDFWIARPFWGLGFATEAAEAAIRIAKSVGNGPIIARPGAGNSAAAHVLGKIGFRPTGRTQRRFNRARDRDVSCAVFEDSGMRPMRHDPALDLYMDRGAMAA